MDKNIKILILIIALIGSFFLGKSFGDPNKEVTYGSTGLPKNCRAIISENYKGYNAKDYSADEALGSINRNCGADGYSWGR